MRWCGLALCVGCGPAAEPGPDALNALMSDAAVSVTVDDVIHFEPNDRTADVGLVFYPGAKVSPEAYAPALRRVAEAGYPVWVVRVTFDLAIFSPGKADTVIDEVSNVDRWAVGGHSLGGVAAGIYAGDNPDTVDGLALWASTPPDDVDLTTSGLAVSTVFASEDGLFERADWEASWELLPSKAVRTEIDGGNHAGFGDYGVQQDDGEATLEPAAQWQLTANATVAMLAEIASN